MNAYWIAGQQLSPLTFALTAHDDERNAMTINPLPK
jgi:hypothetical protein